MSSSAIQQSSSSNSHLKKYKKLKYLGKGSYGAAILVELRSDPTKKFVIKEIVIGHLKPNEQEAAKNEAEVLHQMNHSNITSYIESFVENSKLYIVMEHADGGDLSAAIAKRRTENKYYLEEEAMRIFVQICFALRHIHKANILHRDLKSQNIFMTSNGMVKLGDFGIAKVLDASEDQAKTQIGTPYYLSPEICESKPYGTKSDIWSLGVVLYEILALEMPFQANSLPALVHRICSSEPNYSKIEGKYSSTLIDLCKSLLLKNPDLRPSVNQIVKSDYIKNHISKLLSFTLKSGTGGCFDPSAMAAGVAGGGGGDDRIKQMDADEVERNIEVARGKQPASYAQQDPRQLAREQQLERMRNIRQDMMSKQQRGGGGQERKESESNSQRGGGARPYSPMRGGDRDRPFSPKSGAGGGGRALSPKPNRPLSPKPNNRAMSPKPSQRSNQPSQQQQQQPNPFGRQQSDVAVYQRDPQNNNNNYESAARREYFANRAAAQAIKAKVEQYERGSGMTSAGMMGGGGAAAAMSNDVVVAGGGGGRQMQNRDNYNVGGGAGGGGRRPSDVDFDNMDPETRIAKLKAQREQERERENAIKEMQMKQAIEANREERRRLEALAAAAKGNGGGGGVVIINGANEDRAQAKKAIAFDINMNEGSNAAAAAPPRRISIGGGNAEASAPAVAEPAPARQRRGWGPPVDGQEILQAKGIARNVPTKPKNSMEVIGAEDKITPSSSGANTPSTISEQQLINGMDQLLIADDDNREVLKRLESKRKSQLEVKNEAKEVLRKLREKKLSQAKNQKPREIKAVVVSPVKRDEESKGFDNRDNRAARLMEVMNSVEAAAESVQIAVRGAGNVRSNPRGAVASEGKEDSDSGKRRGSGTSAKYADDIKAVQQLEDRFPLIPEEKAVPSGGGNVDDELEATLDNWLENHMRNNVTVRQRRPGQGAFVDFLSDGEGDADMVNEEEGMSMYSTVTKTVSRFSNQPTASLQRDDYAGEDFDDYAEDEVNGETFDVNRPLRGQVMGDDVEVVGMQCMLAKALMGDDEDDQDYDFGRAGHK